ncbi:hypothetical protein JCM31826_14850 [Thermaurantimonas aggregans]|uniref:CRISPR system ring nuclease SSO1393-like domain-containing protein n=1 Tax=Thermaurantimonas aggregans TaxID=2173829 RepID=A0A401XLW8_9FLAO|nr:hypothetical protein [Thermaurantimonas aggregans]MCX8149521.1 hypothetical protein [Thermaurantimonas aggregans]GCD78003.1 hypothetical protein JCM31826_14850 [Thermaurantimonas aggregans]
MNKTILTTVGTSLISNWKETNNYGLTDEIREQLRELEKCSFFENSGTTADSYINYVKGEYGERGILQLLIEYLNAKSNCAEISSITAIEKELRKSLKEGEELTLTIHLLCTDTILSPLCAEVIAGYLRRKGYTVAFEEVAENATIIEKIKDHNFSSAHIIKNLNLKKYSEQGLLNLIEKIKIITSTAGSENTLLNITGGYKALIPPITILAQLYHLSIYYLYEDSSEIIHLPPMPVGFDWEIIEKYTILLFNENKRNNIKYLKDVEEMRELNLVFKDNTKLTPLGIILSEYLKDKASPLTGTIMGYFVEYKLYKYYQTKFDCNKVKHSVKTKDGGDIDLVIKPNETSKIGIEVKPASVLENTYDSWTHLLAHFPSRVKSLENINEIWLILYGESENSVNVETVMQLKERFDMNIDFKCKFLKIQKSKQSQERHIYQDFFKSDIKDSQLIDIILT